MLNEPPEPRDGTSLYFININVPPVPFYVLMSEFYLQIDLLSIWLVDLADIWDLFYSCTHHPMIWLVIVKCNITLNEVKFETNTILSQVSFSQPWDHVNFQWHEDLRKFMANFSEWDESH